MTRPREGPPPGLLPVAKPEGPTSRWVVDQVVKALGTRRVGHAGTLDPMAQGLILVVWESATGLVPYLQEYEKRYEAWIRFGTITDTRDRTGRVLEERGAAGLDEQTVAGALATFRGRIAQTPPAYSALKRGGRRLYELARRGEDVQVEARPRDIHRFDLLEWRPPLARFVVTCSSGTYVRSLAHDLGQAVGTGACLESLCRTGVGPFRLDQAVPADAVLNLGREALLARAVAPASALPDWPAVRLAEEDSRKVLHGDWSDRGGETEGGRGYRLLDEGGRLLALAEGGPPPRLLRVLGRPEGTA